MEQQKIERRIAVVTGASRGIGQAVAVKLAQEGCNLVLNYTANAAAAGETAAKCKAQGAEVLLIQADVSKEEQVDHLMACVIEAYGRIDILVNNAGITRDGLTMRMKTEDFDRVIEVNLRGTYLCMQRASKLMLRQRYGRIINMSSIVGLRGNAGQINYAASKAGVIGMTKSLAKELAAKNVTVNAVAPGMITTDMTGELSESVQEAMKATIPARRAGVPEDVANAVAFFAKEEAGYVTGQVLCVDGGMAV